jgi:ketosteroid isomerase-like protein
MDDGLAVIERLRRATDAHDLDAIVDCFTDDYVNETPAHPARGFVGRDQVRANWSRILNAIDDLSTSVPYATADGDLMWTEWEMRGTRPDGGLHLMRGVIIFGLRDDRIASARFYLEPVDDTVADVNAAVGQITGDAVQ